MRILLANHLPWNMAKSGRLMQQLAVDLQQAGHDVRCLVIGPTESQLAYVPLRRVPLDGHYPCFAADGGEGVCFESLSPQQLGQYRQSLREALDDEIDQFDPHVMHALHVWIWAHLALETGVPYVATAMVDELDTLGRAPRGSELHELAQQAAENAGRIVVDDPQLVDRLTGAFGDLDERLLISSERDRSGGKICPLDRLVEAYQAVVTNRFGTPPTQ